MARDDWFRNTSWNSEVAAIFEKRLARARDKSQYLRIQACVLAPMEPDVALSLLARYFALGERWDIAQAHVDQASAYLAKECLSEAVMAYEFALAHERTLPTVMTQAYLDLPWLVATRRLNSSYERVLRVLEEHKGRPTFPVEFFRWNAAKALILADLASGSADVKGYAAAALLAAAQTRSAFRRHPDLGLVGPEYCEVINELQKLAA